MRYLARCKLTNALVFFQWRFMTLEDQEGKQKNKEMFYQRIDGMIKNLETGL